MASRAISSGTLSFGLVSIPVKLYSATSSESVRFNMLHPECGSRVKQKLHCPTCDVYVARTETSKGYEHSKGQYVQFGEDELKALETERSHTLEIIEFVPLDTVDFINVEKSYYLGPDKGGDKAFKLLENSMRAKERVAVGSWAARGKEQLILVRPYQGGLILHQLFYAKEVRSYDDVDHGGEFDFTEVERTLAAQLIDQLTTEAFAPEKYEDAYAKRVLEVVEQKVAGQEISHAPEAPKAQIIDLFEALKKSLAGAEATPAANSDGEPTTHDPHTEAIGVSPAPINPAPSNPAPSKVSNTPSPGPARAAPPPAGPSSREPGPVPVKKAAPRKNRTRKVSTG